MSTVHIVDDTESFRHALRSALETSWQAAGQPQEQWPRIAEWDLVWDLTRALEDGAVRSDAGDIVVTDLYPGGYWKKVKLLRHKTTLSRRPTLPGDPTNMYRAVLDIRRRFLPALEAHGLKVIVLTFVPRHIESIRPDQSPLTHEELVKVANKVRAAIRSDNWTVIEKHSRKVDDPRNVTEAVAAVNALLWEAGP
jgi:hypothetical protein